MEWKSEETCIIWQDTGLILLKFGESDVQNNESDVQNNESDVQNNVCSKVRSQHRIVVRKREKNQL